MKVLLIFMHIMLLIKVYSDFYARPRCFYQQFFHFGKNRASLSVASTNKDGNLEMEIISI